MSVYYSHVDLEGRRVPTNFTTRIHLATRCGHMILLQNRRMHVDLVERYSDERKVDHDLQEKTNDHKNGLRFTLSRICDSQNLIKTL